MQTNNWLTGLFIWFVATVIPTAAQNMASDFETLFAQIAENLENPEEAELLFEELFLVYENPLNLNTLNAEDLELFPFLNNEQIQNFLNYRNNYGTIYSVFELQLISGFDEKTIPLLLPFVYSETDSWNFKKLSKKILQGNTGILNRISYNANSTENEAFKLKYYTKIQYNYKQNVFAGFTGETDAGEKPAFIYDHSGFYFMLKNYKYIRNLNIGDFAVKWGQGLLVWQGFGSYKTTEITNIRKAGAGIMKYGSSDENNFMRGAAATVRMKKFDFSAFFSHKAIDASRTDTSFTSFQNTGLHNTSSEIAGKHAVNETLAGLSGVYRSTYFKIGFNTFFGKYNLPFMPDTAELYRKFIFAGSSFFKASIDYSGTYKKVQIFGESAITNQGALANVHGLLLHPTDGVLLSVLARNYSRNFNGLYSSGFGESANTTNENGIYSGISISAIPKFRISAFFDYFEFPWLTYNNNFPFWGTEKSIKAEYTFNRKTLISASFSDEKKQKNTPLSVTDENLFTDFSTKKIKLKIQFSPNKKTATNTAVYVNMYNSTTEEKQVGMYVYQDISYDFEPFPAQIKFRIGIFDIPYYNTRIYAYEHNVLYAFSVPAMYGTGLRTYSVFTWHINNNFSAWLRAGFTQQMPNLVQPFTGLANNENKKFEIIAQIRAKF